MDKCNCIKDKSKFNPVISDINLNCQRTWDMISDGNTLGCFQLESFLGQKLASQCKPRNIEQLAELVSVMRPGCLEAKLEGKTVTEHYILRKSGKEEVVYITEELAPILKDTYGLLLYQEQAMKIATDIANFPMAKADTLRKSIGKKDVKLMAEMKDEFILNASKNVGEDVAKQIFDGIEKSQRYSFNKSHAIGYAYNCYISAYTKCHFPELFFISYCNHSDKLSDIAAYINNARRMGIEVLPPRIENKNLQFEVRNGKILFGLAYIKNLSESKLQPLLDKEMPDTWEEFLIHYSGLCDSTTIQHLIKCGALNKFGVSREKMLYEYSEYSKLSERTIDYIQSNYKNTPIITILKEILGQPTGKKYALSSITSAKAVGKVYHALENPPISLLDNPALIGRYELTLLSTPFTCTELDLCPLEMVNCTCSEFINGKNAVNGKFLIPLNIRAVKEIKTKKGANPGQLMAFIVGYDEESEINLVAFPDVYEESELLIFEGNTVIVKGTRGREGSLNVEKIWQV